MAESFNLLRRRQAEKCCDHVSVPSGRIFNEPSGLAGEIVLRCAQAKGDWRSRVDLDEALGAFLTMLQFYAFTEDYEAFERITRHGKAYMGRIREQCESAELPDLLLKADGYAGQWDM